MARRVIAIALAAVAIASALAAIPLITLSLPHAGSGSSYGFRGKEIVFAVLCTAVGLAIAFRQPRNPIPWLFLVCAVCGGAYELSGAYMDYALFTRSALPGVAWAAWISGWTWIPTTTVTALILPLIFPDGRLPSRRWRPVLWFVGASILLFTLGTAVSRGASPEAAGTGLVNPLPAYLTLPISFELVQGLFFPPLLVSIGISVIALVQRLRVSRGLQKLQMRWMVYAFVLTGLVLCGVPFLQQFAAFQIVNVLSIDLIPLAAGVAILRYRLYEIDLIIRRTVIYGATTTLIAIVFFGGIVSAQAVLSPITSGSEIAVAVSTLVALALFQPLRSSIQRAVDRRFYRTHYDAGKIVDELVVRLRDEVDLDAVRRDLIVSVERTMQPATASLWLRETSR